MTTAEAILIFVAAPLVAWFLSWASYKVGALIGASSLDEADESTATWMTRAHAAEIAVAGLREEVVLLTEERDWARHTTAAVLLHGERRRAVVESAAVVPIKARAKKAVGSK